MSIFSPIASIFNTPKTRVRTHVKNERAERIATMKFSVPALHAGVLTYAPGELEMPGTPLAGKSIRLYNPPEAVSDKDFLKSLETAPVIVGVGHTTTTGEQNKSIDGWAATARYDTAKKAAIIDGVVKGKDEVDYIKANLNTKDFGASAFIDFVATVQSGTTPDGEAYDAIAQDLKVTHVALTEHVRDPKNQIQVRNTVVVNSIGAIGEEEENKSEGKNVEMSKEEILSLMKNAIDEAMTKNAEGEELDDMKKAIADFKAALETLTKAAGSETKERKEEATNEDEKEKKEEKKDGETVENALPSQALVAAFSTALNCDFGTKTPSFKTLASMAGITETDPFKRIVAVNAKFAEISKTTVKNTTGATGETSSFGYFGTEEAGK